jgi:hypothetical protein
VVEADVPATAEVPPTDVLPPVPDPAAPPLLLGALSSSLPQAIGPASSRPTANSVNELVVPPKLLILPIIARILSFDRFKRLKRFKLLDREASLWMSFLDHFHHRTQTKPPSGHSTVFISPRSDRNKQSHG